MHSSTSNSDSGQLAGFKREVPTKPLFSLVWLAMATSFVIFIGIEIHARNSGVVPSRANDMIFWNNHRLLLDDTPKNTTVLAGASRITFGFDLDTWEDEVGNRPFNLGLHGASFIPMLKDYALNTEHNGIIICSVAGGFTFADSNAFFVERIGKAVDDLEASRRSITVRGHGLTAELLQARFAALNVDAYSPIQILRDTFRPSPRTNERAMFFVPYTYRHTEDNQDMFVVDFSDPFHLQEWDGLHKNVLTYLELGKPRTARSVVDQITTYIETIERRGGEVVFVKFPTSRFMKDWEDRRFPRDKYWDIIIEETGCRGFHYLDNTNTRDLFPPDGSHLLPLQAKVFTRELVKFVYPED